MQISAIDILLCLYNTKSTFSYQDLFYYLSEIDYSSNKFSAIFIGWLENIYFVNKNPRKDF